MKGLVFTELLRMAESAVGEDVVDEVLDDLDLASGGAYTAVGNYPCSELVSIVVAFSARTGISADELQRQFGIWVFDTFRRGYPQFFADTTSAFQMLAAIEGEIHVEVRKLYPDAELPRFDTVEPAPGEMRMHYHSERPLVAFCHGLIEACVDHFGGGITVEAPSGSATDAVFVLRRAA